MSELLQYFHHLQYHGVSTLSVIVQRQATAEMTPAIYTTTCFLICVQDEISCSRSKSNGRSSSSSGIRGHRHRVSVHYLYLLWFVASDAVVMIMGNTCANHTSGASDVHTCIHR